MSRKPFTRDDEGGTPFWRIFGAVLAALIVHSLLQAAVVALAARSAADSFNESLKEVTSQLEQAAPVQPASLPTSPYRSDQQPNRYPSMMGPVQAMQKKAAFACVNGKVTRIGGGTFDQSNERCSAYSE
ncbi:MAG: hypothetical protein KUL77_12100 [Thermomonas sp.]|uniref:hypothetical protein n=1 Tax=Thermomonas sp. TaxID=1971895 RepID=UPI001EB10DCF|nr:hypothetical protein [Thermomonas sp.]MBV2210290.1 hypothetical protein [Thermomonas sp.]